MTTQKIKLFAFYQDGGDGGGGTSFHCSLEDLKNTHFAVNLWTNQKEQDRKFQETLDKEDPYENGEIFETEIEIFVDDLTGKVSLAKPFYTHWGQ